MAKFYGTLALALLISLAGSVWAVDGVVDINQARAAAGGVSPGDTAGFPVTISQAGSYRLTGNLTVPDENTTAISVQADYVTIDLNGFSIQGPVTCTGFPVNCSPSGNGVGIDAIGHLATAVRNGSVHGMGLYGIHDVGRAENVTVNGNGKDGIHNASTVTGTEASGNGGFGIEAVTVTNCTANGNRNGGIVATTASACTANSNGGDGVAADSTVTNSTGSSNGGFGVNAKTVTGCTATSNGLNGIIATIVTNSTAQFNSASPQISAVGIVAHNICGDPGVPCP